MITKGTGIGVYRVDKTALYYNQEDGMIYFSNLLGHTRMITMQQWSELLIKGEMCACGHCVACGVLNLTQYIVKPKGELK